MKRSAFFVIVAMILIGLELNCFAHNVVEPIYIIKYHESLRVYPNGKAISHIRIELRDSIAELCLPLIINRESKRLTILEGYQLVLSTKSSNKFMVIESVDNKLLGEKIDLYIEYGPQVSNKKERGQVNSSKSLIHYFDQKTRDTNIGEYRAMITMHKESVVNLSTIKSNEQLNVDYFENDELKEITISGTNISYSNLSQVIIQEKASYELSAYMSIIVVLIIIYVIFLGSVFKS